MMNVVVALLAVEGQVGLVAEDLEGSSPRPPLIVAGSETPLVRRPWWCRVVDDLAELGVGPSRVDAGLSAADDLADLERVVAVLAVDRERRSTCRRRRRGRRRRRR